MLLKAKVDPNTGNALLAAVQRADPKITRMLLEAGAKVDEHDGSYRYAVHFAAQRGALDAMEMLLEKGADINIRDNQYGYTPLHWAIIQGHNRMVELLLQKGARTDLDSNDGHTALETAYDKKNVAIIRLLEAVAKPQAGASAPTFTQTPGATPDAVDGESETWVRMGSSRVAHVGIYPAVGRKLTEIFNFAARERIVITENLKTGAENMAPPESFDALGDATIRTALAAFRNMGGSADEEAVLNPRGMKKQLRQP